MAQLNQGLFQHRTRVIVLPRSQFSSPYGTEESKEKTKGLELDSDTQARKENDSKTYLSYP